MTDDRKRMLLLILLMTILAFIGVFSASFLLYNTAIEEEMARLTETVQSKARLIESIARLNIEHQDEWHPDIGGPRETTIDLIKDSNDQYRGFGKTGEYTLAEKKGNNIVFLFAHGNFGTIYPGTIPFDSELAEPMRLALSGQSGSMIGFDYHGKTVLAAYEPVDVLNLGIVAKIDLGEVREPFVRAFSIAVTLILFLVIIVAVLFIRITSPILERLKISEQQYRDLYLNAPITYLSVAAADGSILRCNHAVEKQLGYTSDDLIGKHIIDFYADTDHGKPKAKQVFDRFINGEAIKNEELQMRHRDGQLVWINISVEPVRDKDGNIIESRSIAIDVTHKKNAEAALIASEHRLQQLIERNADAMVVVDNKGIVRFVNPAAENILLRKAEDLLGELFGFPIVAGETTEIQIIRSGKEPTIAEMLVVETEWEGDIACLATLRDITHRRKIEERLIISEEKYRTILESIEDGYYEIDLQGRITFCNDALCRILGYESKELGGTNISEYIRKETVNDVLESLNTVLKKNVSLKNIGIEILKKDGTNVHVESSASLIKNHYGESVGFRGILRDVTQRKLLEIQLQQSQKLEAIGTLAGGIAHDFNNLMTIVIGNSDLLLMGTNKDDPLQKDIEEIKKAGNRAASLTRQLLAFSRKQVLKPQVLNLNTILNDMEKMLKRIISEDVELETFYEQSLGGVKVDPSQIEQVIMNLAINARDAMPDGGKLTIETANVELDDKYISKRMTTEPGSYVMMSVTDTGIGMEEQIRENIFEPFFTTKDKERGTGLGLSTVYGIVKQSNGYIWVYSEPGQGSTFKVYLPRIIEKEIAVEKAPEQKELEKGTGTILLVEDNDMLRDFAAKILRKTGYKVLEAKDGKEALNLNDQYTEPIQLLLTDVIMPGMNGRELAEQIKSLRPETMVLYFSGYTDNSIVRHGVLEIGIDFLQKPFTPNILLSKVKEILSRR